MTPLEIAILVVIVGAALFFMARRTIRKYRGIEGGCGSKKSKNVSLTIGGEPVKKR